MFCLKINLKLICHVELETTINISKKSYEIYVVWTK